MESPTPTIVDAALRALPSILPVLDFSTIKNELFPVIAAIFSKTNSLAIKVRGLQAFVILCGGTNDPSGGDDGLSGLMEEKKKSSSSTALDKFTMQEKIVPLVKGIKTKEPAVMIAALNVLKMVGQVADAEFVAMDILPILWSMSLGPLLDLKQFQSFMELIKTLSSRVIEEQTKKLQELNGNSQGQSALPADDFMSFGAVGGSSLDANGTTEDDFERLVKGKAGGGGGSGNPLDGGWDSMAAAKPALASPTENAAPRTNAPAFSWSTPSSAAPAQQQLGSVMAQQGGFRTVTPDLGQFGVLSPTSTQYSQPLQPSSATPSAVTTPAAQPSSSSVNWGAAATNPWSSPASTSIASPPISSFGSMSMNQRPSMPPSQSSSFSLPPPPGAGSAGSGFGSAMSSFSLAPPPGAPTPQQQQQKPNGMGSSFGSMGGMSGTAVSSMATSGLSSLASNRMGQGASMGVSMGMGMGSMGSMNQMGSMAAGMSMNNMMSGGGMGSAMGGMMGMQNSQQQQQQPQRQQQQQQQRSGLDKYESLL